MADLSRAVSSQTYNEVLSKSLSPKPKPPLLPKPQFVASNPKNGKYVPVKKIQSSSQTIISVKNVVQGNDNLNKQIKEEETLILNSINIADSVARSESLQRVSEKPPTLYPKPKLPPKTNAFKTARSNVPGGIRSSGEDSPFSPEKRLDISTELRSTPIRPPRSPKRILKDNPLAELRSGLVSGANDEGLGFSKQTEKSASLPRSEFVNWTFREINKNTRSPIKFYQQISSNLDYKNSWSEKEVSTPTPRPRSKNKPKLHLELDLASNLKETPCPIYAVVDYSKKKNRQSDSESFKVANDRRLLRSSDPQIYSASLVDPLSRRDLSFNFGDSGITRNYNLNIIDAPETNVESTKIGINENENENENENGNSSLVSDTSSEQEESYLKMNSNNNNYTSFNINYESVQCGKSEEGIMNVHDPSFNSSGNNKVERGETENSPSVGAPQSFLHRLVSSSTKTKDEEEEEKEGEEVKNNEENPNNLSFLHKNNYKTNPLIQIHENYGSFEVVSMEDVEARDENKKVNEGVTEDKYSVDFMGRTNSGYRLSVNLENDQYEAKDLSENVPKPSSCNEEGSNLGKRFPWFGSFGKGNKKRSEKKERCSSQFYASPINLKEDNNMNDCSRAKSLPNIKSNDKAIDADNRSLQNDWNNRNTDSLNSEYSTLTQNSDAEDDRSITDVEVHDKGKKANKAFLIAKELITSEEVFIDVLKLLNVEFRNFVELRSKDKSNVLPQSCLNKILNHLPELQTLNEVLLADLKKRIINWETNPKISDVIVKKGAFLKLYTSYIQNFESQTKYLDECVVKYPKFGKILKEFESHERCKMLSLKHYMLKPVQRIPQYRLLLSDYLKHIDESSPDYEDTETALKIVSEVADHVNRNLKYGDINGTLMHFQSLLGDYELIKPGRELIKDGPLEKICRKSVKDRYFILLNDCLLHTTYSKNSLKIHQELPLSGMKVCCNEDQSNRYCFTVYSTTRSFILCAKSDAERNDWFQSLQTAIEQYISRQKTFMNVKIPETDTFKIGKEAPVWIQDSKVTMCQICTAEFTSLFRRHHCRACGKVICKNCGGSQAPLQYDSFKPHRVCDQCFPVLLKDYEDSEDDIYEILKISYSDGNQDIQNIYLNNKAKFIKYTSTSKPKFIPPRLKEVSANDAESEMNGLLYRRSRKAWKQYWYVLKEHVLYVYRASEDVKALETIPVLGYEVKLSDVNYENVDKNLIFILEHRHQSPIIFHAETEESAERWYKALKRATEFQELSAS